jgi:hypothetical protein
MATYVTQTHNRHSTLHLLSWLKAWTLKGQTYVITVKPVTQFWCPLQINQNVVLWDRHLCPATLEICVGRQQWAIRKMSNLIGAYIVVCCCSLYVSKVNMYSQSSHLHASLYPCNCCTSRSLSPCTLGTDRCPGSWGTQYLPVAWPRSHGTRRTLSQQTPDSNYIALPSASSSGDTNVQERKGIASTSPGIVCAKCASTRTYAHICGSACVCAL